MKHDLRSVPGLVAGLAVFLPGLLIAQTPVVTGFTELGTLNGVTSLAQGVNSSGQVTGYSYISGAVGDMGFVHSGGSMTALGTLGGVYGYSYGRAINDSGTIVGRANYSGLLQQAFVYSGGVMTGLGTLGGGDSQAEGINNSGQIVGFSYITGNTANQAFLYSGGVMTNLGTLGGSNSWAYAINNNSVITGSSYNTGNGSSQAFLYSGGVMTGIGTLGGNYSEGYAINDAGQVAGMAAMAGSVERAFLYSGGVMTNLGTLGGTRSTAFGINTAGDVVGMARIAAGDANRAFYYTDGTMYDLNTLAATFLSDGITPGITTLTYAFDINDSGLIVGYGTHTGGNLRAFSLQLAAVPEPSTYAVIVGAAALGLAAWRRQGGLRRVK